jgi:hypothetical protein
MVILITKYTMKSLPNELVEAIIDLLDWRSVRCLQRTCIEYWKLNTPRIRAAKHHDHMYTACISGDITAVKYLVNANVNVNVNSNVNAKHSVLLGAALHGHCDIVKYLMSVIDIGGLLYDTTMGRAVKNAASNGHLNIVEYLINARVGASADVTAWNNIALRAAALHGHLDVVKRLVTAGADVTANNNDALSLASCNGRIAVVKYLVSQRG